MATILIADDQADIRNLLKITLEKRGHQVLAADSGTAALQLSEQVAPDLAILDVNMPGVEGTQVARTLRGRRETATIPILLLTALAGEADTLAGFAAGADDYVTKPFNPRELAARVQALLARGSVGNGPSARPQGRLVAVAGPKGGVGRTTVAVNVAVASALASKSQQGDGDIVLLDGHLLQGDLDVHLDLRAGVSVRDLVPYAGRLDVAAVQNALVRHASGVQALLRPREAGAAELIGTAMWQEVLHIATAIGETVIVDLGPGYDDERTLATLESAAMVLLVVTPEIGGLRNARQFLDLAPRLGVDRGRVRVVLNRANVPGGLSEADVASALGIDQGAMERVPDVGPAALARITRGVPVVQSDPGSVFARALDKVAVMAAPRAASTPKR
jgi:two-component system, OmpR family, response regulator MtrA